MLSTTFVAHAKPKWSTPYLEIEDGTASNDDVLKDLIHGFATIEMEGSELISKLQLRKQ